MSMRLLRTVCAGAMMLAACDNFAGEDIDPLNAGLSLESSGPVTPGSASDQSPYDLQNVADFVIFGTDSATLTAEAQWTLQRQAGWLGDYPQHSVTVEGHADERGTREYNLALGERRAEAVMRYLIAIGIDAKRLKTISYGKERPICTEPDDVCWRQNRRAVTVLDN